MNDWSPIDAHEFVADCDCRECLLQRLAEAEALNPPHQAPPQGVQCLVAVTDGFESWWCVDEQKNDRWQGDAREWQVIGWRQLEKAPNPPEGE